MRQLFWVATFKGEAESPSDVVITTDINMDSVRRLIRLCHTSDYNCVWLEMPVNQIDYRWLRFKHWFELAARDCKGNFVQVRGTSHEV